jgi:hypothetical protein
MEKSMIFMFKQLFAAVNFIVTQAMLKERHKCFGARRLGVDRQPRAHSCFIGND